MSIKIKIEINCADEQSAYFLNRHLSANYAVTKFESIPETTKLFITDHNFRALCYKFKVAETLKNEYIKHNNK